MKKFLNILFIFLFIIPSFFNIYKEVYAADMNLDIKIDPTYGIMQPNTNASQDNAGYKLSKQGGLNTITDMQTSIKNILNVVLGFAGTISLIFVIIGGVGIMFSNGDKTQYSKNIKLMTTGGIAFLIILLAYAISRLILGFITSIAG